jgi:hypothetical protein
MDGVRQMFRTGECEGLAHAGGTSLSKFRGRGVGDHEANTVRAEFSELIAQFAAHCSDG